MQAGQNGLMWLVGHALDEAAWLGGGGAPGGGGAAGGGIGYWELPEPGRTAAMYMIWTCLSQPVEVAGR